MPLINFVRKGWKSASIRALVLLSVLCCLTLSTINCQSLEKTPQQNKEPLAGKAGEGIEEATEFIKTHDWYLCSQRYYLDNL